MQTYRNTPNICVHVFVYTIFDKIYCQVLYFSKNRKGFEDPYTNNPTAWPMCFSIAEEKAAFNQMQGFVMKNTF